MPFFKNYIGKQYGDYTLLKLIGEGRYGLCFLAQSHSGIPVVIKRFKPRIFKKNKDKNMFEAVILSQLHHQSIPELLGVINEKSFYGFVLEQKHGDTVQSLLFKKKHRFTSKEIYLIGYQLINIIQYLHGHGVVHRDIRIPNVIINSDKVYLVDFGLARWADNSCYKYDVDYSYLGDFLLYLIYSSFKKQKMKRTPWYDELSLTNDQMLFLKRLLRLTDPYESINEIKKDFVKAFSIEK
ncbi:MAG: serine/threonine protein kinase [Clostridiales bacterium 43-6]|nr:MAG: serine/threonine protein kinase [Clostridiales bacterium 43-6]